MRGSRRSTGWLVGLAATTLTLSACGGSADDADTSGGAAAAEGGDASQVEVFTWWAAGSEKAGLDALVGVFDEQHPDTEFVNGAVAGGAGSAAKDLLQSRLQASDPPDTFQAHAGAELDDYIDAGQIEDISSFYDEFGVAEAFPSDLIDLLTDESGAIYSMPSNIHRSNMVWANPAVLEDAGLDPEATYDSIDDWIPALEAVDASGATALSVGQTWTQVNLLETVLMADLGAEAYIGLWDGSTDWASDDVTGALEDFETLMGFTNADRDGLDWPDATQQVMDGDAAFNVMGDWAIAAFEEQDKEVGTDFSYFAVPGSEDMFGFLADSFTLPVGAPHPGGSRAWLETVASPEGQAAFNKAKGSIPARADVDLADFSQYQQETAADFQELTIVPSLAHGAASSIGVLNDISDATSKFTSGSSDLATFQQELATAAAPAE